MDEPRPGTDGVFLRRAVLLDAGRTTALVPWEYQALERHKRFSQLKPEYQLSAGDTVFAQRSWQDRNTGEKVGNLQVLF